jgi:DNA modification methylase
MVDKPELIPGVEPYYHDEQAGIAIYNADCRDLLPLIPEGSVDLVLTDPPYGINLPTDFASRNRGNLARLQDYLPVHGDDTPFDPAPLLRFPRAVLWGANYYADRLAPSAGWLVWDKRVREGIGVNDQADCELAWTNCVKGARVFRHMWNGFWRDSEKGEHWHPTQKPAALMKWCLGKAGTDKPHPLVLDPYMGSGPVQVACKAMAAHCIGSDIEERYCEIGVFDFGKAKCETNG